MNEGSEIAFVSGGVRAPHQSFGRLWKLHLRFTSHKLRPRELARCSDFVPSALCHKQVVRVIAGEFRSRWLQAVPGTEVRPTPDRLRETLFNILAPEIAGAVFLDVYAGSGAVGIEALSRGAASAVFIENSKVAIGVIEANLKSLDLSRRALILRGTARKKLTAGLADLVFLDPPYPLESEYPVSLGVLGEDERARIVVAQHSVRLKLGEEYRRLKKYRELRQGENALSFYAAAVGENLKSDQPGASDGVERTG